MVQIKPLAHLRPLLGRLPHHSSPHHAHVLNPSSGSGAGGGPAPGDTLNFASNPSLWQHLAGGQGNGASVTGLVAPGGLGGVGGVGGAAQGGARAGPGTGGQGWGAGSRGSGGGGYTGSARAFVSLPQTSLDPSSSLGLTDGDHDRRRRRSSLHRPLQLPSRASARGSGSDITVVDLTDNELRARLLRREIAAASAAGSRPWRSVQMDERERDLDRTEGAVAPLEPRLGRIELPPLTPQLEQNLEQLEATYAPRETDAELAPREAYREGEIITRASTPSGRRTTSHTQPQRPRGLGRSRSTLDVWRVGVSQAAGVTTGGYQLRTYSSTSVRADEQARPAEVDGRKAEAAAATRPAEESGAPSSGPKYSGMDLAGAERRDTRGDRRPERGLGGARGERRHSVAGTGQRTGYGISQGRQTEAQPRVDEEAREKAQEIDKQVWQLMGEAVTQGDTKRLQTIVSAYLHVEDPEAVGADGQPLYPRAVKVGSFEYNLVLDFYWASRQPGQGIGHVLDLYNQMLETDLRPDSKTFSMVIRFLRVRDAELWDQATKFDRNIYYNHTWELARFSPARLRSDEQFQQIREAAAGYQAEDNLSAAVRLWHAALRAEVELNRSRMGQYSRAILPYETQSLLQTAGELARQGAQLDVDGLTTLFEKCQQGQWKGYRSLYGDMLLVLGYAGKGEAVKKLFDEYRTTRAQGVGTNYADWMLGMPKTRLEEMMRDEEGRDKVQRRMGAQDVEVWGCALEALVVAGEKDAAEALHQELRAASGPELVQLEQQGEALGQEEGTEGKEGESATETDESADAGDAEDAEGQETTSADQRTRRPNFYFGNNSVYDPQSVPRFVLPIREHLMTGLTQPTLINLPHLSKEYTAENMNRAVEMIGQDYTFKRERITRGKVLMFKFRLPVGLRMIDALIRAKQYRTAFALVNWNVSSVKNTRKDAWPDDNLELRLALQRIHIGLTNDAITADSSGYTDEILTLNRISGLLMRYDNPVKLSRSAIKAQVRFLMTRQSGRAPQAFVLLRQHNMMNFSPDDADLWTTFMLAPELTPAIARLFLPGVVRAARSDPVLARKCLELYKFSASLPKYEIPKEQRDSMFMVNMARLFGSFGPAPYNAGDKTEVPEDILDGSMDQQLEDLLSKILALGQSAPLLDGFIQTSYPEHNWAFNFASVLNHRFGPKRTREWLISAFGREGALTLIENTPGLAEDPSTSTQESEKSPDDSTVAVPDFEDIPSETDVDFILATPTTAEDLGIDPNFPRPMSPKMRQRQLEAEPQEGDGAAVLAPVGPPPHPAISNPAELQLSRVLTADLDQLCRGPRRPMNTNAAYDRLIEGLRANQTPSVEGLALLMSVLGQLNEQPRVRELYTLGHYIINTDLYPQRHIKQQGWEVLENGFIMALCAMGCLEEAGLHRARLLDAGTKPTADAYAAMITAAKDTTDDALIAREMWDEAKANGVEPNLFLYNTIISKLSRARKAEMAIALFREMKLKKIYPSSVTYGAVINACCRVGDEESASVLFNEMINSRKFKPRVPPYNTMMQFHLNTSPNREKVLYYYQMLRRAGQQPSEHTYKLLLDAYSSLPPLDLPAVESVFAQLCADDKVEVQATHWASMLVAYGIYANDIQKALALFESIPTHPKTKPEIAREAVVWEAMLTIVAHKGTFEQLEAIVQRMAAAGVRATAYVYNVIIAGYTRSGRIDLARALFASMEDAPMGLAAPNNHPQLLSSSGHPKPHTHTDVPTTTVYREPSSYEAMIRAELAAGNRAGAEEVLRMMEARRYPPAVFMRASNLVTPNNEGLPSVAIPFIWGGTREDLEGAQQARGVAGTPVGNGLTQEGGQRQEGGA